MKDGVGKEDEEGGSKKKTLRGKGKRTRRGS